MKELFQSMYREIGTWKFSLGLGFKGNFSFFFNVMYCLAILYRYFPGWLSDSSLGSGRQGK